MKPIIYDAVGGIAGLTDLARAWHKRCLADPVVSHAFSHGFHPNHAERLAAYWSEALGGPAIYTESIGDESSVVKLHSGNGVHTELDERAIDCFAQALDDIHLSDDAELRKTMMEYFRWATRSMTKYSESAEHVPPNLPLPKWTWEGPA